MTSKKKGKGPNITTIQATKELVEILKNLGRKGDSYEFIIRELIKKVDKKCI